MSVALRTITRLQDADDINVSLGAGVDEYALCWDNDTARFVLRAPFAGLLATGATTGATSQAQTFTVGISLADTTTSITGVIFKGTDRFIHNFQHPTGQTTPPWGRNTFLGVTAGNFTLGSTATDGSHGSHNIGIGVRAAQSLTLGSYNVAIGGYDTLLSTTTGNGNVAIGDSALRANQTGSNNVAIGKNAIYSSTGASENVALGFYALFATTSGINNFGLGRGALESNTTGSNNIAVGYAAGKYHANGSTGLTDPENSIYIGFQAYGKDNSDSNSIVIGYQGIGQGANTTVIGNTSTTMTYLPGGSLSIAGGGIRPAANSTTALQLQNASGSSVLNVDTTNGRVGIGTTAPAASLHVNQSSSTGTKPVLTVDQRDVSEEFVRFIGTSTTDASQSLVDVANMTTPGALVGWLKIYVQDDAGSGSIADGAYYVPFYAAPTA